MPIPVPLQGSPFFRHLAGSTEGKKEINGVCGVRPTHLGLCKITKAS